MRINFRWVALACAASLFSVVGVAVADDVSNHVDGSVDAAAEVMPLTLGGANGSTYLYLTERNRDIDGENGCNLQGKTEKLTIRLSSSDPNVATVSPSVVTFNSCGDQVPVSVAAVGAGSATITATQEFNNSGGTFDLRPVTFTVNVSVPVHANTAPVVAVTGFTAGNRYELGADTLPLSGCSVTDAEDGLPSVDPVVAADLVHGLGQVNVTCSYTDEGGLSATASAEYSIVDTTAPVITLAGRTAAGAEVDGKPWNTDDVTVEWTCSDSGSGVVSPTVAATVSGEGSDQTAEGVCEDYAGNTAGAVEGDINIDRTKPAVAISGGPVDGRAYYFGSVPSAPVCVAEDALSGLDGECTVDGYGTGIGSHTVTAHAQDKAGNAGSVTVRYEVKAWTLKGFFSPVDMSGTVNTVKGGSTVPLKFEVFAGDELTDVSAVASVKSAEYTCTSAPTDDLPASATGGTVLRYDAAAGQFVYNWQTPKTVGKCYRVTMTTQDGSSLVALFKTK